MINKILIIYLAQQQSSEHNNFPLKISQNRILYIQRDNQMPIAKTFSIVLVHNINQSYEYK